MRQSKRLHLPKLKRHQGKKTSHYWQYHDCLSFITLQKINISLITTLCNSIHAVVMCSSSNVCVLCMFPPLQHLHRGVNSCPSAELLVPSKHSVIDATVNQGSDHTEMSLQPIDTTSQIPPGGSPPHHVQLFLMSHF